MIDVGFFWLCWEMYMEFFSYIFFCLLLVGSEFDLDVMVFDVVYLEWMFDILGKLIVVIYVELWLIDEISFKLVFVKFSLSGCQMVVVQVVDGNVWVFIDFKIDNGFLCFFVFDVGMIQCQVGCIVQCLVEIEMYWVMVLFGLLVVKEVVGWFYFVEKQLVDLMDYIGQVDLLEDECVVLVSFFKLVVEVECLVVCIIFCFGVVNVYYGLVLQCIIELCEECIFGLLIIDEFM